MYVCIHICFMDCHINFYHNVYNPVITLLLQDDTDSDWKKAHDSINLPQSTSIGVLYNEVSKRMKYVEGTFLLVWEKKTGEEEVLGENSSATMYEMQMDTQPSKTKLYVRQKDGVQPQQLEVNFFVVHVKYRGYTY